MFKRFFRRKPKASKSDKKVKAEVTAADKGEEESREPSQTIPKLELALPDPHIARPSTADQCSNSSKSLWVDVNSYAHFNRSSEGLLEAVAPSIAAEETILQQKRSQARLDPESVGLLVKLCSKQIQQRGLESLGLFRSYRWAEDAQSQEKLIDLFLRMVYAETATEPKTRKEVVDMFKSKLKPEEAFREALHTANIHDIVAIFKYGLRHLYPSIAPLSTQGSNGSWTWLEKLEQAEKTPTAYSKSVLPLFQPDGQVLVGRVVSLIAAVATFADKNGMTSQVLCKLLGFWLFSKKRSRLAASQQRNYRSFEELYTDWRKASRALELVFIFYLREEMHHDRITIRLREVLQSHETEGALFDSRECALKVVLASDAPPLIEFSQSSLARRGSRGKKGSLDIGSPSPMPRRHNAGDLISMALSTDDQNLQDIPDELQDAWRLILKTANTSVEGQQILDDRMSRLMSEDAARIFRMFVTLRPVPKSVPESPTRRRSFSVDSPTSPSGLFVSNLETLNEQTVHFASDDRPNSNFASTSSLTTAVGDEKPWQEFMSTGFGDAQISRSNTLKLDSAFEATDDREVGEDGRKLKRRRSSMNSLRRKGATPAPGVNQPLPKSVEQETLHLKTIQSAQMDDCFADLYLDILSDPDLCSRWIAYTVIHLRLSVDGRRFLILEETDPIPDPATSVLPATPESLRKGSEDRKKDKSPFTLFGRRSSRRLSDMFVDGHAKQKLPLLKSRQLTSSNKTSEPIPAISEEQKPAQPSITVHAPDPSTEDVQPTEIVEKNIAQAEPAEAASTSTPVTTVETAPDTLQQDSSVIQEIGNAETSKEDVEFSAESGAEQQTSLTEVVPAVFGQQTEDAHQSVTSESAADDEDPLQPKSTDSEIIVDPSLSAEARPVENALPAKSETSAETAEPTKTVSPLETPTTRDEQTTADSPTHFLNGADHNQAAHRPSTDTIRAVEISPVKAQVPPTSMGLPSTEDGNGKAEAAKAIIPVAAPSTFLEEPAPTPDVEDIATSPLVESHTSETVPPANDAKTQRVPRKSSGALSAAKRAISSPFSKKASSKKSTENGEVSEKSVEALPDIASRQEATLESPASVSAVPTTASEQQSAVLGESAAKEVESAPHVNGDEGDSTPYAALSSVNPVERTDNGDLHQSAPLETERSDLPLQADDMQTQHLHTQQEDAIEEAPAIQQSPQISPVALSKSLEEDALPHSPRNAHSTENAHSNDHIDTKTAHISDVEGSPTIPTPTASRIQPRSFQEDHKTEAPLMETLPSAISYPASPSRVPKSPLQNGDFLGDALFRDDRENELEALKVNDDDTDAESHRSFETTAESAAGRSSFESTRTS